MSFFNISLQAFVQDIKVHCILCMRQSASVHALVRARVCVMMRVWTQQLSPNNARMQSQEHGALTHEIGERFKPLPPHQWVHQPARPAPDHPARS